MIQQVNQSVLQNRPTTPIVFSQSSRDLILPPCAKEFVLPLKPFRIPYLHTKDARSAIVNENDKFKRPSTASSIRGTESSLASGIRAQVGESRNASSSLGQISQGISSRPSTSFSNYSSPAALRPKSAAGTSRNRSLTDQELDRIDAERRRLDDRLISMKGILNDMNAQSKFMDEELKRLQFKSTMLDKDLLDCDVDAEHRLVQSLHAIQTKTEYWIQSVKEEELYTTTLALVLERNSAKRADVETKFNSAQAELAHYDHDLHVLSIRLHQAKLEQSASEKAHAIFAEDISNWREQRDAQMAARSKQVSDMRLESIAVSKQEDGAVHHAGLQRSDTEFFTNTGDSVSKRSLQEGMLQMKRLTQQESAASIAACYNNSIERTAMFLQEEEATKKRIADCKVQKEMLSKTLEMLKYGGDDTDANADQIIKTRTAKLEKYISYFMRFCHFNSFLLSGNIQNTAFSCRTRKCNLQVSKQGYRTCKTGLNAPQLWTLPCWKNRQRSRQHCYQRLETFHALVKNA
jgi:hypothetical protein